MGGTLQFNRELSSYVIDTHEEEKPTTLAYGTHLIELSTLDQYINTKNGWVFERNLQYTLSYMMLWDPDSLDWVAATGSLEVGQRIEVIREPVYSLRMDEASETITYIGEAAIGSAENTSVWRIKKLDTTSGVVILWADGTQNFTKVWTNRATYNYS